MLTKYSLFFLFLFCSINTHAGIWGDIGECITDPCNCGQSERTETWNAGSINAVTKTFKTGTNCPPWNKSDGRDNDNCLLQFDYPGRFTPFVLNRCAQESPDSSYFTPKITIRIQSCNAAACWSQNTNLNWDGECVLWPTGYGLPLTRVCARIALPVRQPPPGINSNPSPADPGYTAGFHLNKVGFTDSDDTIVGVDRQILTISSPKLCAYSDPGLVNLVSDSGVHIDPLDWNPNSQPLHKTTKLSPIAQVLNFLVITLDVVNIPKLLGTLLGMISQDLEIIKVLQTILNAIGDLFNFLPNTVIIPIIEAFGSLNGSVDDYSFGCVQLPLGPYPPPFCKSLNELSVPAVINNVCSIKSPNGTFNQSSAVLPCVVSNVRNNIINNTVRVSFNNLIPLCTGAKPDLTTCVEINGSFTSASGAHTATAYTDFIKPCSSSSPGAPCINTNIKLSCDVATNGCNQGFRIVYSQVMGTLETPSDYFISDIPDCGTAEASNSTSCQKIWGANIGQFVDVSVQFPEVQDQKPSSLMPIQQSFTLNDNNNNPRSLYASISNTKTDTQDPTDICVFESSSLAGCVPRVSDSYSLATYECEKQYSGITCPSNTYYTPQFVASMQVQDDKGNIIDQTSTLVTPLSYAAPDDPKHPNATESIVTLAGYNYSSSVAFIPKDPPKYPDDKYIAMPFSGPNALNQITIYGVYKDNIPPYDNNGNPNPNAVYLKYLEYVNGKYVQGGTHTCLMPKNFQHCSPVPPPPSTTPGNPNNNQQINCVLAKLDQPNTVDCSVFKSKVASYANLSLCESTSGCSQVETLSGTGKGITIYSCANNSNCYINNDNPNTPVCVLTIDYLNRINPLSNLGSILDATQYYKVTFDSNSNPTYDVKTSDVRDKTWRELNLCSPILAPVCSAITSPQAAHGNALWDETDIGDLSVGRCPLNWVEIDPSLDPYPNLEPKGTSLKRYCLSNFDNKNIEFEPLNQNIGCRESKGLPIEIIDNNFPPSTIRPTTPYDPNTKIGNFYLNKEPKQLENGDWAFDSNDGSKIDATDEPGQTKLFTITFKLTLNAIMTDIDYFKILDLWYDDCTLVYVNNQQVISAPISTVDSLDNRAQCNNGNDQGQAMQASVPIDIKSYLKQGENTIKFQLRVIGSGGLYYHMQYKMLR